MVDPSCYLETFQRKTKTNILPWLMNMGKSNKEQDIVHYVKQQ